MLQQELDSVARFRTGDAVRLREGSMVWLVAARYWHSRFGIVYDLVNNRGDFPMVQEALIEKADRSAGMHARIQRPD